LGDNYRVLRRRASIFFDGRLVPYPFQMHLASLPLKPRVECVAGLVAAALRRERGDSGITFADWIERSLGRGIAKHFMVPYNEKLWTIPPSDMTLEWMGEFVPKVSKSRALKSAVQASRNGHIGYNAEFAYPLRGGIVSYVEALASHVSGLKLSTKVESVDAGAGIVRTSRGFYRFSTLISTIPLVELVSIMVDTPPALRRAADQLKWNSICSVLLGIDRPNVSDQHWIYFPQKDLHLYRVGFPSNLSPHMCPEGTSSLCAEIAYRGTMRMSKGELIDRVIQDLESIGLLHQGDRVLVRRAVDTDYGYVIYDRHWSKSVSIIQDYLRSHNILSVGRYGGWEYSGMEEAVLQGRTAAEMAGQRDRAVGTARRALQACPSEA
jgi:UDP-galactopyranose mutase